MSIPNIEKKIQRLFVQECLWVLLQVSLSPYFVSHMYILCINDILIILILKRREPKGAVPKYSKSDDFQAIYHIFLLVHKQKGLGCMERQDRGRHWTNINSLRRRSGRTKKEYRGALPYHLPPVLYVPSAMGDFDRFHCWPSFSLSSQSPSIT